MATPSDPVLEHIDAAIAEAAAADRLASEELKRVWAQFCVDDCF